MKKSNDKVTKPKKPTKPTKPIFTYKKPLKKKETIIWKTPPVWSEYISTEKHITCELCWDELSVDLKIKAFNNYCEEHDIVPKNFNDYKEIEEEYYSPTYAYHANHLSIQEVLKKIENKKQLDLNSIYIKAYPYSENRDDNRCIVHIVYIEDNKNYDKELKAYNKAKENFKKKQQKYKKDYQQYKKDYQQYKKEFKLFNLKRTLNKIENELNQNVN